MDCCTGLSIWAGAPECSSHGTAGWVGGVLWVAVSEHHPSATKGQSMTTDTEREGNHNKGGPHHRKRKHCRNASWSPEECKGKCHFLDVHTLSVLCMEVRRYGGG